MGEVKVYRRRDITIVDISKEQSLILACDSCGGIGEKENDTLKVLPDLVGLLTARVVIMEVICTGAEIISLSNAVCNEMNATGQKIMAGVKKELAKAKAEGFITADIDEGVLTGSTEENMVTTMTAIGITAIGVADKTKLKFSPCQSGDEVIVIGEPLVGNEVLQEQDKMVSYSEIKSLLSHLDVREIVPVGSKGIAYEAKLLAEMNGIGFVETPTIEVDIMKSGGPCTCVVAVVAPECKSKMTRLNMEYKHIGTLV